MVKNFKRGKIIDITDDKSELLKPNISSRRASSQVVLEHIKHQNNIDIKASSIEPIEVLPREPLGDSDRNIPITP
jgi:hypothetical protein